MSELPRIRVTAGLRDGYEELMKMIVDHLRLVGSLTVVLAGCLTAQGKDLAELSVETVLPYEIERWQDDFPYSLHVPPRHAGLWYDRNSQQALEKIIANLSGLCTKDAWVMSKEFFDRHWDQSRELLIEKLDETSMAAHTFDHAENILNVIARSDHPGFGEVLLRLTSHSHPGIRRAAYRALLRAGDNDSVVKSFDRYSQMSRSEQIDWVKAAARKVDDELLFPLFRNMLTQAPFEHLRKTVFDEAMLMERERAVELLDPIWRSFPVQMQVRAAGMFVAAGDGRGVARLRPMLELPIEDVGIVALAVQAAGKGDPTLLADELLTLTNEDYEALNLLIIDTISGVPGGPVSDTLVTLTLEHKPLQVQQAALRALLKRGETAELDALVEIVRSEPRGAPFQRAVANLVGAKYAKAVPVLLERLKKAGESQESYFIRMIAQIRAPESFEALTEIFMRPEYRYEKENYSNVTFLGVQLANVDVAWSAMIELMESLPQSDYRRRGTLIHTLANIAGAFPGEERTAEIYDALRRRLFDAEELPQIRILSLNYLRKDIRLSDAMRLRSRMRRDEEGLRMYFSDYLREFF